MSTRTSRAVVLLGEGRWEIQEFPVPDEAKPGGAILRVEAAGMCHSDIDNLNGIVNTPWGGEFPTIPGHETVGRIEQLGEGSAEILGVKEGDRVAVRSSCMTPEHGSRIYGHDFNTREGSGLYGGYSEYMELLPGSGVIPLPGDPPATEMTIWEPLSIALGWAAAVSPGDTVAILGPGHLGLATIVAAQIAGASRIFVTGITADAFRLEAAKKLGAEFTVDVMQEDAVEKVLEATDGKGVDVAIDAAANATSTVIDGMRMARRGGELVIGGVKGRREVPGFVSDWVPLRGLRISPGRYADHAKHAAELLWAGKVPTADVLGEVYTIDQVGEAFDMLDRKIPDRDAIRVQLRLS